MRYFSTQVTSYPLIFSVNNRQKLRNEWKQMYILKKRYRQKYVHKQAKMESQRNVACSKNKKNAIDINVTQMMVGKQWVKR